MKKRVEPLEVATTTDGAVDISQEDGSGNDAVVHVPVHQIDLLVEWLNEAKAELLGHKPGAK